MYYDFGDAGLRKVKGITMASLYGVEFLCAAAARAHEERGKTCVVEFLPV
jgi:hypothetical protein